MANGQRVIWDLMNIFRFDDQGKLVEEPQTRTPSTPAGETLRAWLDAFNSGDRVRMENFVKTVDPAWNLDGMVSFRRSTGDFDLLSIKRSEPLRIWLPARHIGRASDPDSCAHLPC